MRGEIGFRCPVGVAATVSATSPIRLRSWVHGVADEIGASGARLRTHEADGLAPAAVLRCSVVLPFAGTHEVAATVERIEPGARGTTVDIRWAPAPDGFLRAVSEYLLMGGAVTPLQLQDAGLSVRGVDRVFSFGPAAPGELDELLDLRLRAHQCQGRLTASTVADLASPFDEHACYLVCRHGRRIVGCVRVIFVDGDPARSQYVTWGGHEVPDRLWRSGFVEAGAGAVDPEYQGAGLFRPLMQHAVRVAVETGHRHVLGAAEDDVLPIYLGYGFRVLESRDVAPRPGWAFRSHLIVLDVEELLAGPRTGGVAAMAEAARFALDQPPQSGRPSCSSIGLRSDLAG